MMYKAVLVAALIAMASATCKNPVVASEVHSTTNGMLSSESVVTSAFSVTCDGKAVKDAAYTATLNGNAVAVATSADGSKYQLSSFAEHANAGRGGYEFVVSEGETEAFRVTVYHGGASSEPLPFSSEVVVFGVFAYLAYMSFSM
eukprot:m.92762 g.92762  ORF g.92762 m.92762 type:complete len:145 (-) comp26567_c1_seq1:266-700(-)